MKHIFYFELKCWMKSPVTWIFSIMAFVMGCIMVLGSAGYFGGAENSLTDLDSPYHLWKSASIFFKLLLFAVPAVVGHTAAKDFIYHSAPLIMSFPVRHFRYTFAKYAVSALLVLSFAALFLSGFALAASFRSTEGFKMVLSDLNSYRFQLLLIYVPNVLLITAWVYATVHLTKEVIYGYFMVVSLFILKEIFSRFFSGAQQSEVWFILDPFADFILQQQSDQWSLYQQNHHPFVADIRLWANRVFWLFIATLSLLISLSPRQYLRLPRLLKRKTVRRERRTILPDLSWSVTPAYSPFSVWSAAKIEYLSVIKTRGFQLVLLLGGIFLYVLLSQMNAPFGVKLLPTTWLMLAFPVLFITMLIHFVTFLYAGILTHRDILYRMNSLIDSAPVSNRFFAISKLITLCAIQVTLLSLVGITGIVVQLSSGYYRIELPHYLIDLLLIHFPGFVAWSFVALLVHQLLKNNWVATVLLILLYFGVLQAEGISHLLRYNRSPYDNFFLYYSDFTGHGHSILPFLIYKFYWLLTGILLFAFTILMWRRGYNKPLITRVRMGIYNLFNKEWKTILPLIILILTVAVFIRQNESAGRYLKSEAELNEINKEADKRYARLSTQPQPRITHVVLHVNIYPEEQKFDCKGTYTLKNTTGREIDTLIISRAPEVTTRYSLGGLGSMLQTDDRCNVDLFKLHKSLLPGETLQLTFENESFDNRIFSKNNAVEKNGTYLTSTFLPVIGYRFRTQLQFPEDHQALRNHYRSSDADWVSSSITLSTAGHQTPLSTGSRVKSWEENGRKYARFISCRPVTHDYCFLSGEYAVHQAYYRDVLIEIYHLPRHRENIGNLLSGVRETLKYGEEKYGPYPDGHLRLVEFPRNVGEFAQSFAGIIPYSELGFMVDVGADLTQNINLPFLGAAHEMAHQWWGMQVIPADALGSRFITEGMAEFTAFRVYKSYYGEDKATLVLNKAHMTFANQMRENPSGPEVLKYCSGQPAFIAYQKALLSLNAIRLLSGEKEFDRVIRSFYQNRSGIKEPPYASSLDFIDDMASALPGEIKPLLTEYVTTNTLYTNCIELTGSRDNEKDSLTLMVRIEADNQSPIQRIPVQLGIYYKREALLPDEFRTFLFPPGEHRLRLPLNPKTEKIVLDPDFLMTDLNRRDNVIFTTER